MNYRSAHPKNLRHPGVTSRTYAGHALSPGARRHRPPQRSVGDKGGETN